MIASDSPFTSKLSGPIGNGRENKPADVMWVKHAMCCLGRYNDRLERNGYIDRGLHEAIDGYQRDRGLRRDGWIGPGGETERAIRLDLSRLGEE